MSRVLVAYTSAHPVNLDRFRQAFDGTLDTLEMPVGDDHAQGDALLETLDDHAGLFVRSGYLPSRVFEGVPSLRAVSLHGSGYDHVDLEAATRHGVVVTHNPEAPGPAVVEHTIAFMITLLRDLPRRFNQTADGDWLGAREILPELGRRTVGVIGLGTIGFPLAIALIETFGCKVIGHDPYVKGDRTSPIWPRVERSAVEAAGIDLASLESVFDRASVVTVHTPLTPATTGLIGNGLLERLDGGYVINVARGGVVDEGALERALDRGDVIRAGLDVTVTEPPPPAHPLLDRSDVYVTPHVAGVTDSYLVRAAELAAKKLGTALSGGRPDYTINPAVR